MRRHHIVGSPCRMQCHAACVLQAWFTSSEHVVGPEPLPVGTGEVQVGQGIHLGLFHDGGCLGTALLEHLACQVVGTTHHTRVLGPEDRGDDLGDPPLQLPRLGLADAVAREVVSVGLI